MTTHLSCFELYNGHNAQSVADLSQSVRAASFSALPLDNASGISDLLDTSFLTVPLSCYTRASFATQVPGPGVNFQGYVVNDGGTVSAQCDGATPFWTIQGPSADNSGNLALEGAYNVIDQGRNAPPQRFRFSGAALAAAQNGGTVESMSGTVLFSYSRGTPYQGILHLCEFEEQPPDRSSDATEVVTRITRALQAPPNSVNLGQNSVGDDIIVKSCGFTGIAPEASVYVDATDIGNGPGQIPQSVTDNLAVRFRAHPSVFLRRTRYSRSVARQYNDSTSITAPAAEMPVRIVVVTPDEAAPVSNWLISVDGVPMLVQVDHNTFDPLVVRPRDIWNQFWVPLINGDSSVANAPLTNIVFGNGGTRGPAASQLRLRFLEYARCLPLPGEPITQTNSTPQ